MEGGLTEKLSLTSSKISGDGDRDRLETALGVVDGVRDVEVNPDSHTVDVVYDPTIVNATRLQAAVEEAGYQVDQSGDQGGSGEASAYLGSEMTGADQPSDQGTDRSGTGSDLFERGTGGAERLSP